MAFKPISPSSEPPVFDIADELEKFYAEHPEEDNAIEKMPRIISQYFSCPEKPDRCKSPKTIRDATYVKDIRLSIVTEEQKKANELGPDIIQIKPLIKGILGRCVVL